jgi:hypothetical protein
MRALLFLAGLLVVLSAIDAVALDGRYRQVAWQEATYQGNKFNNGVRHWLQQLGISR